MSNQKTKRTVELIDVTPKVAAEWLELNHRNRPKRPALISLYANTMRQGEWKLTSEPIMFSDNWVDQDTQKEYGETLMEGQHRLEAVIESGMTIPFTVWRHCDWGEMEVIGTARPRKQGDILAIMRGGEIKNAPIVAGICSAFLRNGLSMNTAVESWMIRRLLKRIEPEIMVVVQYKSHLKGLIRREFLSAALMAQLIDPETINTLVQNLRGGMGYGRNDPSKALREYIFEYVMSPVKDPPDVYHYKICNAIAGKLGNRTMTKLELSTDGLAYLRNQAKAELEPILKDIFGRTPQGFYNPTLSQKLQELSRKRAA
jgi:hypothetical protein